VADSPLKFSVAMPGEQILEVALQRFSKDIDDFTPFWEDYFLPAWYRSVDTNFTTRGASTGAAWPALSAAYDQWKQKHWPGLPPNVLSGALRESLTVKGDVNSILEISNTSLKVGTVVPYAMFVQMGTGRRGAAAGRRKYKGYTHGMGGGMPARPVLRVQQEFVLMVAKLLQEFGVKTARAAGLTG
jgi:phage gpG-like protein